MTLANDPDPTTLAAESTSAIESIRSKVASIGNPVDLSGELDTLGRIVEQLGYVSAPPPDDSSKGSKGGSKS